MRITIIFCLALISCLVFSALPLKAETSSSSMAEGSSEKEAEAGSEWGNEEINPSITFVCTVQAIEEGPIPILMFENIEQPSVLTPFSVDMSTAFAKEILKICPSGSRCKFTAKMEDGTFAYISRIQKVK